MNARGKSRNLPFVPAPVEEADQANSNDQSSPGSSLTVGVGMFGAEKLVQLACPGLSLVLPDSFERP
jgi:hypothetical protein